MVEIVSEMLNTTCDHMHIQTHSGGDASNVWKINQVFTYIHIQHVTILGWQIDVVATAI